MDPSEPPYRSRAAHFESLEDQSVNPSAEPTLGDVIQRRFNRRELLKGLLGVTAVASLGVLPPFNRASRAASASNRTSITRFTFDEIAHGADERHHVAPGYDADILIRWGDPVTAGAPTFDPQAQTATTQCQQFGYNNDFVGFIPLPLGSSNSDHGLLCVNHEYTDEELMFPGLGRHDADFSKASRAIVDIEMASHGGSVIEIRKVDGKWHMVEDSRYARRINALDTQMRLSGPAAGHDRLKTVADPSGTQVIGTLNNCAGGITPWGTYLMAEENFHYYFRGNLDGNPEQANYRRYGIPIERYAWGRHHARFDLEREPNAPNLYGWVVEVDPLDPDSVPVKRTALGRFKHEGAESIVNKDGRLVLYSGDDQRFEFLYRFVSRDRVNLTDRAANRDLLDRGTLSAARFNADGSLDWLPLVQGDAGLTTDNGFASQADVVIEARRAATLLGATPMDRPEDVEPNPVNGRVYVMLTNNAKRTWGKIDAANPRGPNLWGHVLELAPPDGDHAAATARWEILVKAGDPKDPAVAALWNPATSVDGWFACPDNSAVDPQGRLWVATDQGGNWKRSSGSADGLWALETEDAGRGTGKMFFRAPIGAEVCGPRFTPDGKTLFVAVQHPAVGVAQSLMGLGRASTFENPATRWPDFCAGMPPRPSVVAITRRDGGPIGG